MTPLALSLDVSAVPVRPGGAGYYTMALASGLVARDDVALTLISRRDDETRWTQLAPAARVRAAVPIARPARLAFEQVGLPSLLRSLDLEVHHGPHYTMPSRSPVPCVVTIHDCTFFDHPEWHVRSKAAFFRRAIRRAARQAAVLICVSQVTEDRLRACCDVRAPVVVAPHGVGGVVPGQGLGQQHRRRAQLLQGHNPGHRQVGDGPDHPLGLGPQGRGGGAGVDLGEAHGAPGAGEAPGGRSRPRPVGRLGRPARRDLDESKGS